MAQVFIGVGSNINPRQNIRLAVELLGDAFGELQLSSVYQSEAVGFAGDDFYNMVVGLQTDRPIEELARFLRQLEFAHGRPKNPSPDSGRQIDLDILTYDNAVGEFGAVELPRAEILYNAFVLWPLAEIAGESLHPVEQKSYAELWAGFDQASQRLSVIDFNF